jgi:hypothetical protein
MQGKLRIWALIFSIENASVVATEIYSGYWVSTETALHKKPELHKNCLAENREIMAAQKVLNLENSSHLVSFTCLGNSNQRHE